VNMIRLGGGGVENSMSGGYKLQTSRSCATYQAIHLCETKVALGPVHKASQVTFRSIRAISTVESMEVGTS
jgi:hypothetical protein